MKILTNADVKKPYDCRVEYMLFRVYGTSSSAPGSQIFFLLVVHTNLVLLCR